MTFFKLPFNPDTFILDLETLNRFSDFRIPNRPYLHIQTRKISYNEEVWTLGVTLNKGEEERVYLKVTPGALFVSCSVGTDETHLSYTAYCALSRLIYAYDKYDFEDYYWPDLSGEKMQRKFLMIDRSKGNLKLVLKVRYHGLYKPGKYLPIFERDTIDIDKSDDLVQKELVPDSEQLIGYCLADTRSLRWQSTSFFPFLVPYTGVLNKNKNAIKGFTKYILNESNDLSDHELCDIQGKLNEICFSMKEIALKKIPEHIADENIRVEAERQTKANFAKLFKLWHQAFPLLYSRLYTHYHFTYGMRHVKAKPRKSRMVACTFSNEKPQLCFTWKEKEDYYKLELGFMVKGHVYEIPGYFNTSFFVAAAQNWTEFYLLNTLMDCNVLSYFWKTNFRILVLKVHYERYFKQFVDQLRDSYKFINR